MSYYRHSDNVKLGAVMMGLGLAGYGLFKALEWLLTQIHCLFESF